MKKNKKNTTSNSTISNSTKKQFKPLLVKQSQKHAQNNSQKKSSIIKQTSEQIQHTSTHLWSQWRVLSFDDESLFALSHQQFWVFGLLYLFFIDLILIFPTDQTSLLPKILFHNFLIVFFVFLLLIAISFIAVRIFGSKTVFSQFFLGVFSTLFLSLLFVSVPVALVGYVFFQAIFGTSSALTLFFSIIPFYNYLVFGWSVETLARIKGYKSILIGLLALLFILAANICLRFFLV